MAERILVAGASGTFGKELVKKLMEYVSASVSEYAIWQELRV